MFKRFITLKPLTCALTFGLLCPYVALANPNRSFPTPDNYGVGHGSISAEINKLVEQAVVDNEIPGLTVSVSKDGRMVYNKGFGYANWQERTPMQPWSRSLIGSTSKVLATAGMMKLVEEDKNRDLLKTPVYGQAGILKDPAYQTAIRQGARRHRPIIDTAIGKNNRVFAWYFDGKVTEGTSEDLDAYSGPQTFSVPPQQSFNSIRAIAKGGPQNRVYVWYDDGSISIGTPTDLDAFQYRKKGVKDENGEEFNGYKLYMTNSHSIHNIVGIGMDTEKEITYTWYHDGTVSSGSVTDLASRWGNNYVTPGETSRRYDIVGVAVSANDTKVAWYSDQKASKGHSTDLGAYADLYDYERRRIQGSIHSWLDDYQAVEVQHLLSHTSGLTRSGTQGPQQAGIKYEFPFNKHTTPLPSGVSHRYVLSTRKRLFAPGTDYQYSNHGMGVVGLLIQTLSGQSYDVFLKEHIFKPIGITNVIPRGTVIDSFIDANPHSQKTNGEIVTHPIERFTHPGSAAGSLKATAGDLVRFMLATDQLPNHPDVLKPETLDIMESQPFPNSARNAAHGWLINRKPNGETKLHHNGRIPGGGTAYMVKFKNYRLNQGQETIDVGGINVAIATNSGSVSTGELSQLAHDIAREVGPATIPANFDLLTPVAR